MEGNNIWAMEHSEWIKKRQARKHIRRLFRPHSVGKNKELVGMFDDIGQVVVDVDEYFRKAPAFGGFDYVGIDSKVTPVEVKPKGRENPMEIVKIYHGDPDKGLGWWEHRWVGPPKFQEGYGAKSQYYNIYNEMKDYSNPRGEDERETE